MKNKVCCVGHMCTDILVRPVDRLPARGTLSCVDSIIQKTGGCAMNAAIALARLGIDTAMVGKIGDDGFGAVMRETLLREGVNTEGLFSQPGGITSGSIVVIGADAERSILHCLGTNQSFCFEDVDLDVVAQSRILFLGGTFLLPSFDGAGAEKLLRFAQARGVLTVMDTAWDATGRWLEVIEPCLKHLDWFVPSIEEAEQMFGTRDPETLAAQIKARGVKNVVIKMGSAGCYVQPAGEKGVFREIFPVDVMDTAGAGDAWCAGFLAGLIHGHKPESAAVIGNAVGALCVTAAGTTAGIRSYDETLEFIKTGGIVL